MLESSWLPNPPRREFWAWAGPMPKSSHAPVNLKGWKFQAGPGQLECGMSIAPLPLFYLHGDMGVDSWHTQLSELFMDMLDDQWWIGTILDHTLGERWACWPWLNSTFARHRRHEVFSTAPKWDISPFASITGQTVSWASTLIAPRHAIGCGKKHVEIEAEVWFQRGLEEPRDNAQFHWLGYAKTAFGFRMWLQAHTAWEVSGAVNLKMKLKMTQKFREKPADSLQIYAKKMYNLTTILKFLQLGQCGYLGSESLTLHLIQRCFLIIDTWIIDIIWVSDIYQILR